MPISTKKLKTGDCEMLVDKMVARIRIWSFRYLSFADRMQLVDSVNEHQHILGANFYPPENCYKEI